MKTKKCYTCQTFKPITEFNKNKGKKDGLNTICKECSRKCSRQYYKENLYKHRKETRKRSIKAIKRNKKWITEYKLKHGCRCCNENDPCCLDFHHVNGKKESTISNLATNGYSLDKIKNEVKKCVLVCSNCHRKIHAKVIKLKDQS